MGFESIWHWIVLLIIVLLIFGTSKITKMGPDLGNAVRGFKKAMQGDDKDDEDKTDNAETLKADPPDEKPGAKAEAQATADAAAPKTEEKSTDTADSGESK